MLNFKRIVNCVDGYYSKTEKQFETTTELEAYIKENIPYLSEVEWLQDKETGHFFYNSCSSPDRVYAYSIWAS